MGVDKIGRIAETLVAHGKSPDTPVALVQEGTTAAQRRVDATLATVAETVAHAGGQAAGGHRHRRGRERGPVEGPPGRRPRTVGTDRNHR